MTFLATAVAGESVLIETRFLHLVFVRLVGLIIVVPIAVVVVVAGSLVVECLVNLVIAQDVGRSRNRLWVLVVPK